MINKFKTIESISKRISSGITPLRSNQEFWQNGTIPWLKTEQLGEYEITDTNEYINDIALRKTGIKINPENTVSVAMYGEGRTRGNVSILKTPMTTNQACCNIEVNSEIANYRYVYYWLKCNYHQLRSLSSGVRKNLNADDIKNFPFNYKELDEQERITKILRAIDDKIQLNKKINTQLESLAKTIYNYWFVQFDFPNEDGKPYKTSGGEMEWNEELKREIPKGWMTKSLYDIATYTNGLAMQKHRPNGGHKLPVIKIKEMNEGYSAATEYARPDIEDDYLIKEGDILFSWSASLNVMIWADKIGALNQHIFKVTSELYPRYYFYHQISNYLNHFKLMAENRKTTMGHITIDHLKESRILVPDDDSLILKCGERIEPILDLIVKNRMTNIDLMEVRDFLLPMLMNGQVKVRREAREQLSMAAEQQVKYEK